MLTYRFIDANISIVNDTTREGVKDMREELLMGKLVIQKMNVDNLLVKLKAHNVSMSRSAFYNKKNGTSDFTRAEIKAISEVLNLSSDEVLKIFFS